MEFFSYCCFLRYFEAVHTRVLCRCLILHFRLCPQGAHRTPCPISWRAPPPDLPLPSFFCLFFASSSWCVGRKRGPPLACSSWMYSSLSLEAFLLVLDLLSLFFPKDRSASFFYCCSSFVIFFFFCVSFVVVSLGVERSFPFFVYCSLCVRYLILGSGVLCVLVCCSCSSTP